MVYSKEVSVLVMMFLLCIALLFMHFPVFYFFQSLRKRELVCICSITHMYMYTCLLEWGLAAACDCGTICSLAYYCFNDKLHTYDCVLLIGLPRLKKSFRSDHEIIVTIFRLV